MRNRLSAGVCLLALAACQPAYVGPYYTPPPMKDVPQGMVETPGVSIASDSGQFVWASGQLFQTPYSVPNCPAEPKTTDNLAAFGASSGQHELTAHRAKLSMASDASGPPSAPGAPGMAGAVAAPGNQAAVWVTVPTLDQPLYGLLLLCSIPPSSTGAAANSHLIRVPNEYVEATAGGTISVMWEMVQTNSTPPLQPGWILYLSRQPLPGVTHTRPPGDAALQASAVSEDVAPPDRSSNTDAIEPPPPGTNSGSQAGLGVQVRPEDGMLVIVAVQAESGGSAAGLVPGDRITAIDGMPVAGTSLEEAVATLRGTAGTKVDLIVKRLVSGKQERVKVVRQAIAAQGSPAETKKSGKN